MFTNLNPVRISIWHCTAIFLLSKSALINKSKHQLPERNFHTVGAVRPELGRKKNGKHKNQFCLHICIYINL